MIPEPLKEDGDVCKGSEGEKGGEGRVGKGSDQVWEEIDASAVDVNRLTDKVNKVVSRTLCALPAFSQT